MTDDERYAEIQTIVGLVAGRAGSTFEEAERCVIEDIGSLTALIGTAIANGEVAGDIAVMTVAHLMRSAVPPRAAPVSPPRHELEAMVDERTTDVVVIDTFHDHRSEAVRKLMETPLL